MLREPYLVHTELGLHDHCMTKFWYMHLSDSSAFPYPALFYHLVHWVWLISELAMAVRFLASSLLPWFLACVSIPIWVWFVGCVILILLRSVHIHGFCVCPS